MNENGIRLDGEPTGGDGDGAWTPEALRRRISEIEALIERLDAQAANDHDAVWVRSLLEDDLRRKRGMLASGGAAAS